MGYQCISYWYVGGWNQHGWPLNHFSARERRFCSNVPVEAWNSSKGSYIEQKNHRNLVKANCKRNSPKSGMYVGVILLMKMTSKFRHHHYQYHHFICNVYFYTFASNSSKTNWRFCMRTDCIAELLPSTTGTADGNGWQSITWIHIWNIPKRGNSLLTKHLFKAHWKYNSS